MPRSEEEILQGFIDVLHAEGPSRIPAAYLPAILEEEVRRLSDFDTGLVYFAVHYGLLWVKGRGWQRFCPDGKPRVNETTGKDWAWQQKVWGLIGKFYIFLILKARQLGLTLTCSMTALWIGQWLGMNPEHGQQVVTVFTNKMSNSKRLVRKAREMYKRQPDWLNQLSPLTNPGITRMEFGNGSSIEPFAGNEDASRAEGATWVLVDEVGHIDNLDSAFGSFEACADNGGRIVMWGTAKGTGTLLHQWCIDATAGEVISSLAIDSPDGVLHLDVYSGLNEMTFVFLPWILHADRDAAWLERKRRIYKGNLALFDQEYPLRWEDAFIGTGSAYFDYASIVRHATVQQEVWEERDVRGTLIWDGPEGAQRGLVRFMQDPSGEVVMHATWDEWTRLLATQRPFVIGADCAGDNPDGDYHAASAVQTGTIPMTEDDVVEQSELVPLRQLVTIHGYMDADLYAMLLVRLGYFCGRALLAIEMNGVGQAVGKQARRLGYPALYTRRTDPDNRVDKALRRLGWVTSQPTKHVAYGELERLLRNDFIEVRDVMTLDEMRSVRNLGGGRLGASSPKHDDRPDALSIACAVAPRAHAFQHPAFVDNRELPEFSFERFMREMEEEQQRKELLGSEQQTFLESGGNGWY
jgi:hypothetical protein